MGKISSAGPVSALLGLTEDFSVTDYRKTALKKIRKYLKTMDVLGVFSVMFMSAL